MVDAQINSSPRKLGPEEVFLIHKTSVIREDFLEER